MCLSRAESEYHSGSRLRPNLLRQPGTRTCHIINLNAIQATMAEIIDGSIHHTFRGAFQALVERSASRGYATHKDSVRPAPSMVTDDPAERYGCSPPHAVGAPLCAGRWWRSGGPPASST